MLCDILKSHVLIQLLYVHVVIILKMKGRIISDVLKDFHIFMFYDAQSYFDVIDIHISFENLLVDKR